MNPYNNRTQGPDESDDLAAWRDFAITRFPTLREHRRLLTGDSLEGVEARAEELAGRLQPASQQRRDLAAEARELYGPQGGSTGNPVPPAPEPALELENKVRGSLRRHGTGIKRDMVPRAEKPTSAENEKLVVGALDRIARDMLFTHGLAAAPRGEAWHNLNTGQVILDNQIIGIKQVRRA